LDRRACNALIWGMSPGETGRTRAVEPSVKMTSHPDAGVLEATLDMSNSF
jgi:hypothetical protein